MKQFLKAWSKGVGILAFYFCLSLALGVLGFVASILPTFISFPLCVLLGPPLVFWVSKWIAPDLFPADRPWWRGLNKDVKN
jgi:hypothetical protein